MKRSKSNLVAAQMPSTALENQESRRIQTNVKYQHRPRAHMKYDCVYSTISLKNTSSTCATDNAPSGSEAPSRAAATAMPFARARHSVSDSAAELELDPAPVASTAPAADDEDDDDADWVRGTNARRAARLACAIATMQRAASPMTSVSVRGLCKENETKNNKHKNQNAARGTPRALCLHELLDE